MIPSKYGIPAHALYRVWQETDNTPPLAMRGKPNRRLLTRIHAEHHAMRHAGESRQDCLNWLKTANGNDGTDIIECIIEAVGYGATVEELQAVI